MTGDVGTHAAYRGHRLHTPSRHARVTLPPMSPALRLLLRDTLATGLLAVLFFLWVSSFFTAWSGHAVSVRASQDDRPSAYRVLIIEENENEIEVDWPAEVVEGRGLPINNLAIPPADIPEERPQTRKSRFQLVFYVENEEGVNDVVATTSPRGLGLTFIVWALMIALRNMLMSGSPLDYERRERILPESQAAAGSVAPPKKKISRKTRPERRRGKRR